MNRLMKSSSRQLCAAVVLVTLLLAACSKSPSSSKPGEVGSQGVAASAAPGPHAGNAPAGSRPGSAGSGSLAGAVGQVEQSFAGAKAALAADDIETLVKAMAAGRQWLSQISALLPRANLAPAKLQAARAATAALESCCSQAETALRTGQEVDPSQLQSIAQQIDAAIASLKANTAGVP